MKKLILIALLALSAQTFAQEECKKIDRFTGHKTCYYGLLNDVDFTYSYYPKDHKWYGEKGYIGISVENYKYSTVKNPEVILLFEDNSRLKWNEFDFAPKKQGNVWYVSTFHVLSLKELLKLTKLKLIAYKIGIREVDLNNYDQELIQKNATLLYNKLKY